MPKIKDVLLELNPWWKEPFNVQNYKERKIYSEIQEFMHLPQIIALTGLRRVGKTTLMLKLVEDTIRGGLSPTNILYFSFDEFREVELREVLKEYEVLVERGLHAGRFLVLFDEIQKLEGWEDQLKALYDVHKRNIKFVISGSESLFIRRWSKETLAGRLFEFRVEPLSFQEYLVFRGIRYTPVGVYERELEKLFDEFIYTQGFPELVSIDDKSVARKYLRESIVEKVIFRDLPSLLGIKDISVIESLLNILVEEPGQLIEISELAGTLKVSRKTLSNYLTYLEQSFLLRKLYNFSTGRRKVERKLRKYYPVIASVDLVFGKDDFSRSRVFEWAVVNQLKAEFFWRDPYKNEVDVVLGKRKPIPLEVKYGKVDTSGLQAFMNKFKVGKGYVVTPNREETRKVNAKTVFVVPAFKLLLESRKLGS
jgi:predicted AAA+ superfamily ATPase